MPDPAVDKHNALIAALRTQAARYRTTVVLSGPFVAGAAGHTANHNEIGRAFLRIRDVGNSAGAVPTIVLSLPDVAHVGDTGHVADHALFDAALAVIESAVLPWEV